MTLSANAQGTVSNSAIQARLRLTDARRADFVPAQTLAVDLQCLGTATGDFHSFEDLHCSWPPAGSSNAPILALTGAIPDIRNLKAATFQIGTPGLGALTLLQWLRIASARVPADISAAGALTGSLTFAPSSGSPMPFHGELLVTNASLINPHFGTTSLVVGDVALSSAAPAAPPEMHHTKNRHPSPAPADGFLLAPTALALGGKDPATLDGHFDGSGYTLHLTGMASIARLQALAAALPQLGDGLNEVLPTNRASGPFRIDFTATRQWGKPQIWTDTSPHLPAPHHATRN
jgi:AsmA protein